MNKRAQMAASEFLVIIVLVLVAVCEGWYIVKHKSESVTYAAGSNPKVTPVEVKPSFGGCASVRVMEIADAKDNPVVISPKSNVKP